MKIRTDFVTNSSSSSFVTFSIHNKELAEICKKYNIPVSAWNGKVEATWYSEDSLYNHYPSDGNVALWFAELLTGDFDRLSYSDAAISDARAEITAKATQLSSTTEFSTIEICQIDTEDVGSSYFCQEKEKGVIKTISVDEEDWEGDDEDRALWQVLSEEDFGSVVEYAEEHGFVSKQADKYSFNPDASSGYKASYEVELVGTGKEGRAPNHEYMSVGDTVELVREPNNPYDANAILVTGKGRGLGHVPAYVAEEIAWQLDSGKFIVANAKVNSATPLSQRGNRAKNPLMTISFDIVASDNKTTKNSKKETATKASTKKAKSKSSNEDIYGKSAFVEIFDLIIDSYDFNDETKQEYHDELIKNIHGYMFALLMLSFSNDVEPEEIAKVLSKDKIEEILGINRVFVIFITQMYTIITGDGYSEEIIKQVYGAISYAMSESRDVYCNFSKRMAKKFPNVKSALKYINDLLSQTESMDNVDDDNNDLDIVAAEQAKTEIVDSLDEIKKDMNSIGEQLQAMAEEARIQEEKLIASGEKRPFNHKVNDIVPEELLRAIKAKNTFGYSEFEHEELFEMYDKILEISKADIDNIRWSVIYEVKDAIYEVFDNLNKREYLHRFNHLVNSCEDSIIYTDEYDCINNDVAKLSDFDIKDGKLIKYNGKASFVDIPEGVIEITEGALYDKAYISYVTIPESVEKIDNSIIAWTDCTKIYIPKRVKNIHEKAFSCCKCLADIVVSEENEYYSAEDGVLYNKNKTELLFYLDGKKDKVYTIPKHVKKIGKSAFDKMYNNSSYPYRMLEKLIIPENVEIISEAAFAGLDNLKVVEIHNGVKNIEKDAFKNCAKLEEVYIPESVEKLLVSVFTGCKSLKKIYISNELSNPKVLENIEKIATKYNIKIIKADISDLINSKESSNSIVRTTVETSAQDTKSFQKTEQPVVMEAKSITNQKKEEKTSNDSILKDKADKRIKELEKQIKSNNDISTFGSMIIVGGLLLSAFFLYCVIDEYNAYQVSSAFYNYVSTDSITISLVLLAISLIIVVFGFVKKCKGKKAKGINSQLQNEINILKDPKNHKLYFENEEKAIKAKENQKIDTKKKLKTTFITIIILIVMFIIAFFVIRDVAIPLSIYNNGIELLNNGDYSGSINTLTEVYETKDAQEKIVKAEKEILKQAKVGDVVLFGRCSQTESFGMETPIEWIVIDSTDKELLLLSKLALEMMVVSPDNSLSKVTKNFKKLLDSSYESYFSTFEREMVQPTKSPQFEGMSLFILDDVEIKKYFPTEESRKLKPTRYYSSGYHGDDLSYYFGGYIPWLTIEREDGWYDEIDYLGNSGTYDYYGIRPAIWVSIEN